MSLWPVPLGSEVENKSSTYGKVKLLGACWVSAVGIAAPESPSWYLDEILHYYTSVPAWFPSETVGSTYDSHFRSLQPFSPGSVSNWTVGPLLLDNQILPSGPIPVDLKRCSVHPVPNTYQERHRLPNKKAVHNRQQWNPDFQIWRGRREDRQASIKLPLKRRPLKPANVTKPRDWNTIGTWPFHSWPLSEVATHLPARCPPPHIQPPWVQVTAYWPMPSTSKPGIS